jgi:hypothetical protein
LAHYPDIRVTEPFKRPVKNGALPPTVFMIPVDDHGMTADHDLPESQVLRQRLKRPELHSLPSSRACQSRTS